MGQLVFISFAGSGAAGGDVVGPASSVDGTIALFDGITGKLLEDSGILPDPFTGDSGAGGVIGFVPAPAAGDAAAFKYLNSNGNWETISADQIAAGFSIASFAKTAPNPGTILYRRGDQLTGITVGATYVSGPPTVATLGNTLGGSVGVGDVNPAAWTFIAPFAAGSQPANVRRDGTDAGADPTWTITLNATKVAADSDTVVITWTSDVFYGVNALAGPLTEAQAEALTSLLTTTKNRTITVSPSSEYVWYYYPKALGTSTFTLGGFPAAFETPVELLITNANGIARTYYGYRSTNLLTGTNLAFVVT